MKFVSTRNSKLEVSGAQAVVKGLSEEGGLFVPAFFPEITKADLDEMRDMSYDERSAFVIGKYLPELIGDLNEYTKKAYARFDGDPAPLVMLEEDLGILELWHGPTHAFKDIALTLLPYLLTGSKKAIGKTEKTLILVATSGDTGKAALEGFSGVAGTDIIVFYPVEGVSKLQKLQMMTQKGDNVYVAAIRGNFDDAQTAVKKIFTDKSFAAELKTHGVELSSANSINFGRLVPQVAYYFSAYLDLLNEGKIKDGEKVNFCVPSGNFGNILAGYYAKRMGLPVGKLICASNKNNVLTDFIGSGKYDARREFYKTTSPSMDILISSNLERLVYELSGRNDDLTASRMASLSKTGSYEITKSELDALESDFWAACASEDEVADTIADYFDEYGYIADPHTAVGLCVRDKYIGETGDDTVTVVLSTASPYKFVDSVLKDIGETVGSDELDNLKKLEEVTALPLPETLGELTSLPVRFTDVIDPADAPETVMNYVKK